MQGAFPILCERRFPHAGLQMFLQDAPHPQRTCLASDCLGLVSPLHTGLVGFSFPGPSVNGNSSRLPPNLAADEVIEIRSPARAVVLIPTRRPA